MKSDKATSPCFGNRRLLTVVSIAESSEPKNAVLRKSLNIVATQIRAMVITSLSPGRFIYLFLYSSFRFVVEFFRGDSVRGILSCGLSISQAVSLILFILSSSYILFKIWLELFAEKQCMFYKNFWE